jgi:hypothetical protein
MFVALLAGCNKGPNKLIGTWTGVAGGANVEMTFKADGTFSSEMSAPQNPAVKILLPGKYRESGDSLYLTFMDVQISGLPDAQKAQEGTMKDSLRKGLSVGTEQRSEFKWISDTQFTTTDKAGTATLTKKV